MLAPPKALGGEPEEPDFPFAHLIDWKRIVVVLNKTTAVLSSSEPSYDALVERLIELEPRAQSVRRYMRRVAHWLLFDAHAADGTLHRQDAAICSDLLDWCQAGAQASGAGSGAVEAARIGQDSSECEHGRHKFKH